MVLLGELIGSYIIVALIINLCTMRKLKRLEGEERKIFIVKRRIITLIIAISFLIFSAIMYNIADVR